MKFTITIPDAKFAELREMIAIQMDCNAEDLDNIEVIKELFFLDDAGGGHNLREFVNITPA